MQLFDRYAKREYTIVILQRVSDVGKTAIPGKETLHFETGNFRVYREK